MDKTAILIWSNFMNPPEFTTHVTEFLTPFIDLAKALGIPGAIVWSGQLVARRQE